MAIDTTSKAPSSAQSPSLAPAERVRHPLEMVFWAFRNVHAGEPLTRQQRAWLDEAEQAWNQG
jgi:hypothetical protein